MNESTLLTKAVSALVFRRFTTPTTSRRGDDRTAPAATAAVSSGRKIPTKTTGQAAWLEAKHE